MNGDVGNTNDGDGRIKGVPRIPSFSTDYMNPNAEPSGDFYEYCVGNWIRNNPIPADKSSWDAFHELLDRNYYLLREILENCASDPNGQPGRFARMLGDFYRSSMDSQTIERLKFSPISEMLSKVDRISSIADLVGIVAELHRSGSYPLFFTFSEPDKKNSSVYALTLYQGGLSLPDREYYLSENFKEVREQYGQHIANMFRLLGTGDAECAEHSKTIISLETELARFSRSRADLRDEEKNYNRVEVAEIEKSYALLGLGSYLKAIGIPGIGYLILGQPEFFQSLQNLINQRPLEEWKTYLKWKVLNTSAPLLHSEVEMEHFDFFNRKLLGQQEPEPRWKRTIVAIDNSIGEALGEIYVNRHFGRDAKSRMEEMISDISDVFRDKLSKLEWMSEDTKKLAKAKFDRFRAKIGHPDKFRDYSSIVVKKDDYLGNVLRSFQFEFLRQVIRSGKPVDRNEWYMTPPTINAYFSPTENEIVFPAGILQPPFFDISADDAVNYGAIGGVISHEITHGYDDQGRKYDANGNLNDWWKPEDGKEFMKRAKSVVEIYNSLEVIPGLHVNGQLTLGENIADFGGVSIAYEALQRRLSRNPELRKQIGGLSPEQRFFISWAQVWRQNVREPEIKRRITIDPHSPDRFRATVPVLNHFGFEKAFQIDPAENGSPKVSIW